MNAVEALNALSTSQREVYNLLNSGLSPEEVANKLKTPFGVVRAQMTRIRSKGIKLPVLKAATHEAKPSPKPKKVGPTSNEGIEAVFSQGGPARYQIPEELKKVADKHGEILDVHPMALLGVTIQYVKLCGGRMHAHQVIEDVYGALRAFVNDAPDATSEQFDVSSAADNRLSALEDKINNISNVLRSFSKIMPSQ